MRESKFDPFDLSKEQILKTSCYLHEASIELAEEVGSDRPADYISEARRNLEIMTQADPFIAKGVIDNAVAREELIAGISPDAYSIFQAVLAEKSSVIEEQIDTELANLEVNRSRAHANMDRFEANVGGFNIDHELSLETDVVYATYATSFISGVYRNMHRVNDEMLDNPVIKATFEGNEETLKGLLECFKTDLVLLVEYLKLQLIERGQKEVLVRRLGEVMMNRGVEL